MKKTISIIVISLSLLSCQDKKQTEVVVNDTENGVTYEAFGDSITADSAMSSAEMMEKFSTLKEGDTLNVKFKSSINDVCSKKGCWMKLELADEKEAFVKFKDYAFFVPKDANEKEAIVNGKAFVSMESVEDLRHYAKDAGKSQEAIASIVAPKVTYSFLADGVLIAK